MVPSLPRRGSISSLSSVSSVLEERDDDRIRCCHHCMDTLLKRQEKLEEKDHVPDIVKLYEVHAQRTRGAPLTQNVTHQNQQNIIPALTH